LLVPVRGGTSWLVTRPSPPLDRFAAWPAWPARLLLAALALLLAASALVPIAALKQEAAPRGIIENAAAPMADSEGRPRDHDLAVYDAVIARMQAGEGYYDVVLEEHRKVGFPVRPGFAVRLPTLAWLAATLGDSGLTAAAFVLFVAVVWAWWRRLSSEPGLEPHRAVGIALIVFGAVLGLNRYFFVLHELWAGMLLALALALYRPGQRWGWTLALAALALAIREHVLPFVLLAGAMALWWRNWREAAAWLLLAALFLVALIQHHQQIALGVLPGDLPSAPWLVLRGLSGWLSNVVLSSNLRFLPHWLAGPLVALMVLGWSAWATRLGTFATLLFLGYGLAFMIAGRPDNYYWGAVIAPPMFLGLAFAVPGFKSLWQAARLGS
jgi:hypothetical protein